VAFCGLQDFLTGLIQNLLVVCVLPQNQALDDPKKPLALSLLSFFCRKLFRTGRWVIDDRSKKDGPAGGQRAARPPEVQGGGVAMSDGLLACRGRVDGLQRQCDLDELLMVWRQSPSFAIPSVPV